MTLYAQNARWLRWFTPFRILTISSAYLTPFFLQFDMSLWEVFLLQSFFSATTVLWEIPSGMIADRFGRVFCIRVSAPIAAVSVIAYGFSSQKWQFYLCELLLAVAYGFVSGIDKALLYDSLMADGLRDEELNDEYTRLDQRIASMGFAGVAAGVPIALLVVQFAGVSATFVADGLLLIVGMPFTFKLLEPPRFNGGQDEVRKSAWHAMRQLGAIVEARWLVVLTVTLSTATYLVAWLSAPYYASLGIPVVLFSVLLAARSAWKAVLSHVVSQQKHLNHKMALYCALALVSPLAMATGQWWLLPTVLGIDTIQALQSSPIIARLNRYMEHAFRATMNSMVNLVQRLVFAASGPLIGLLVDRTSLAIGFVTLGIVSTTTATVALVRLYTLHVFSERR